MPNEKQTPDLAALVAHPGSERLLSRVLAAPSRAATPEERAIFEAFKAGGNRPLMSSDALLEAAAARLAKRD